MGQEDRLTLDLLNHVQDEPKPTGSNASNLAESQLADVLTQNLQDR